MKIILEFLVALILHPLAVLLLWIDLARRPDLPSPEKIVWAIVGLIWGIGPILYVLVGDGVLWGGAGSESPLATRRALFKQNVASL